MVACVTAISFRFPGGEIEQANKQAGKRRSAPGVMKKTRRKWKGRIRSQFRSLCVLLWKRVLRKPNRWMKSVDYSLIIVDDR